jgi:hypothetical protein
MSTPRFAVAGLRSKPDLWGEHGRSSFDDHVRDNDKDNDPRDRAGQKTQCTKHDCLVGNRMAQLLKDCHQGRNEIQALT